MKRMFFIVWYVLCFTPQTIPEELFETIPPILAAFIEAGSGPIRLLYFDKYRFALAPTTPGDKRIDSPWSIIS